MYKVKEIYYTLQGEGFHTGRPAVFCRFSGCNLWSGREEDRAKAICTFCDTDFWGTDGLNGGSYDALSLVQSCARLWPKEDNILKGKPFVVCTGGEPALQLDQTLVNEFHNQGFELAIETNGTIELPSNIDWVCVSPKSNSTLLVDKGDELKLVFPQDGQHPREFESLEFDHFYLQPLHNEQIEEHTKLTISFCKDNPLWNMCIQTHKILDIP